MSEETTLQQSLELLWEGRPEPTRGPKPALTLDQIVDTAVKIADAEGIDALSMRRLARELAVGTMTLYRYVPEKGVLTDLMLNRVWAPDTTREAAGSLGSWRDVLAADAHGSRRMHLEHPWLLQVNTTRPVLGPAAVEGMEIVMSGLTELPFTGQEKMMLISALDAYVTGSVRQEIMYTQAAEASDIADEEFWNTTLPYLEKAMNSGVYPTMASMEEDTFDAGWEETFEFGLTRFLDGVEQDVASRRSNGTT